MKPATLAVVPLKIWGFATSASLLLSTSLSAVSPLPTPPASRA